MTNGFGLRVSGFGFVGRSTLRSILLRSSDVKKADFRTFYRDAHAVECFTEREKMLIGLTVAMMRLCDP